jgi:hypothetical protein
MRTTNLQQFLLLASLLVISATPPQPGVSRPIGYAIPMAVRSVCGYGDCVPGPAKTAWMASVVVATSPHLPALQPDSQSQAMAGPLSLVAVAPAAAEPPTLAVASGEGGADVVGWNTPSTGTDRSVGGRSLSYPCAGGSRYTVHDACAPCPAVLYG